MVNTAWKDAVNAELPCPCKVTVSATGIEPIDDPSGRSPQWKADNACKANFLPHCDTYHPGAYGCIRSTDSSNIGDAGKPVQLSYPRLRSHRQICYPNIDKELAIKIPIVIMAVAVSCGYDP